MVGEDVLNSEFGVGLVRCLDRVKMMSRVQFPVLVCLALEECFILI